jgi:hypothetical protein
MKFDIDIQTINDLELFEKTKGDKSELLTQSELKKLAE